MNYDEISKKIYEIKSVIGDLKNQIPVEKSRDKCGLRFAGGEEYNCAKFVYNGDFKQALIKFGAQYGYYGDSSAYDVMSSLLAQYILFSLRGLEGAIIDNAIKIAEKDIQELSINAKEEAQKIIDLSNGLINKNE